MPILVHLDNIVNSYQGYWYLASPYSHSDHHVMHSRFVETRRITAKLMKAGVFVFSPIVHCHELACMEELPRDHQWWVDYDMQFLKNAVGLFVCKQPGWEESKGVRWETEYARRNYKPTFSITPPDTDQPLDHVETLL